MKVQTSTLIGPPLAWAVAQCEGTPIEVFHGKLWMPNPYAGAELTSFDPAERWDQGGPISERENIRSTPQGDGTWTAEHADGFGGDWDTNEVFGPTELVAKMRCYVLHKLGPEVDVPEELLT